VLSRVRVSLQHLLHVIGLIARMPCKQNSLRAKPMQLSYTQRRKWYGDSCITVKCCSSPVERILCYIFAGDARMYFQSATVQAIVAVPCCQQIRNIVLTACFCKSRAEQELSKVLQRLSLQDLGSEAILLSGTRLTTARHNMQGVTRMTVVCYYPSCKSMRMRFQQCYQFEVCKAMVHILLLL